MKFNIEIEIDWIDEESGDLDEAIQDRLVNGLARKLETEFMQEGGKKIAQAADKLLTAKTELLINTVLEQPVVVSDGWRNKKEYESIYDMVEQRMTALYQGKLNNDGKCEKDPLLANIEKYVETHIGTKIHGVEQMIDRYAKKHAADQLKQNSLINSLRAVIPDVDDAINK